MTPVTAWRILIAKKFGLQNTTQLARACREAGVPFYVACALMEQESGGRNTYGHDRGAERPGEVVTAMNFLPFLVRVMNGALSNGVGPCQITYAGSLKNGHRDGGYFRLMLEQGLRPWAPYDNMLFGLRILAGHRKANLARDTSWVTAGRLYNGRESYGRELQAKVDAWKKRLRA